MYCQLECEAVELRHDRDHKSSAKLRLCDGSDSRSRYPEMVVLGAHKRSYLKLLGTAAQRRNRFFRNRQESRDQEGAECEQFERVARFA